MEIGETIAVTVLMQKEGRCIICSQKHEHSEPKKDEIKEVAPNNSGWKRKSMSGVFKNGDKKREAIYPCPFPPPYAYQGHHCVALSALVTDVNTESPKDRNLRLNFYLDQVGFFPNRPENCIGLPKRSGWGDFVAFFDSIDLEHPLQLHGPGHDERYFTQCDRLLSSLLTALTNPILCEKKSKDEWKDLLKKRIAQAENFAFKKLASNDFLWRLHHDEQITALRLYFLPEEKTMKVKSIGGIIEERKGKGKPETNIACPDPELDTGPFS